MYKSVLVIGCDSFVGKLFIEYFSKKYNIIGISRKECELKTSIISKDDFWDIDVELFKNIDIVFNCAAIVHQTKYLPKDLYDKVNFHLAVHLANLAKQAGVKYFIQMSTIAVYGKAEVIDYSTLPAPTNYYGISKLQADNELLSLQNDRFKALIIRPPMIYGDSNAPGNMKRLITAVLNGVPMPFKNFTNRRSLINIQNLLHYIEFALDKNIHGVFLVADDDIISTEELVRTIAKIGNKRVVLFNPFVRKLFKLLFPNIHRKLFGDLLIYKKRDDIILPSTQYTLVDGLKKMIK